MALRIRRGTEAQRSGRIFELGEIVYTTDYQQLWVGDGVTPGGVSTVGTNVAGYGLMYNSTSKKLDVQGLTTDDVDQGINNKYFSTELAVDAVGAALVAGNATNVGITFTYSETQDDAGRINATVELDGVGLTDIISDTSPQLGGDLDINEFDITGVGNIDITGDISASGALSASSLTADTISNGTITLDGSTVTVSGNAITVGENSNPLAVTFISDQATNAMLTLRSLTDGTTSSGAAIEYRSSRGTTASPTAVQTADAVSLASSWAHDGTGYIQSSIIGTFVDPNGSVATNAVTGMIGLINFVDTNPANYRAVFLNRKGWLTVGRAITEDAKAHVDINGVMLLAPQTAEPVTTYEGMIAVADRVTWDPASKGTGGSYPAYFDGSNWHALF